MGGRINEEVWEFARKLLKEKKDQLAVAEGGLFELYEKEKLIHKLRNDIVKLEEMIP